MAQYGGYIIEPFGRVYMGVQAINLEYKTRHRFRVQDTNPIPILIYHVYNMYTLIGLKKCGISRVLIFTGLDIHIPHLHMASLLQEK
jgi:hypothetical protein